MSLPDFLPVYGDLSYGYKSHNSLANELAYPICTLRICGVNEPQIIEYDKSKAEAIKRMEDYKALEDGWDGYNAKKINEKVIETAKDLIKTLPSCPEVFPTCEGNIQFQFEDSKGNYLELEILDNNEIEVYMEMEGKEPKELSVNIGDVVGWKKIENLVQLFKEEMSLKMDWLPMSSMQMKNYFEPYQCTIPI